MAERSFVHWSLCRRRTRLSCYVCMVAFYTTRCCLMMTVISCFCVASLCFALLALLCLALLCLALLCLALLGSASLSFASLLLLLPCCSCCCRRRRPRCLVPFLFSFVEGRFALHVASKALEYYAETVFKVPYPLQKSDLLAIPGEAISLLRCG